MTAETIEKLHELSETPDDELLIEIIAETQLNQLDWLDAEFFQFQTGA